MGLIAEMAVVHHPSGLIVAKQQGPGADRTMQKLVRAGEVERIARGVYAPKGARSRAEMFRLKAAAVGLTQANALVTGPGAAALLGLSYVFPPTLRIEVLVPYMRGSSTRGEVHRRGLRARVAYEERFGIRVTTPARTAIESALVHGVRSGLVVAESALWHGRCTGDELRAEAAAARNRKGLAAAVEVVEHAGDGSQSPGETLTAWCLRRAGLPAPLQQVDIFDADGVRIRTVDFFFPELGLVIEFDGDEKTSGKYGDPVEVARGQLRAHDALTNLGLQVIHLKWADVFSGRCVHDLATVAARRKGKGREFRGSWAMADMSWAKNRGPGQK